MAEQKNKTINPLYIVPVILILIVIYVVATNQASSTVARGDNISVYYTGTLINGTVFDSNVGGTPLNFTVGSGQVITGFDQGVIGMKINEPKTLVIPANDAYGEVNPALILHVPLSKFGNQTVKEGMEVSQSSNGQTFVGVVTAVNSTNATLNFNPPLAGKTLIFNITVLEINGHK